MTHIHAPEAVAVVQAELPARLKFDATGMSAALRAVIKLTKQGQLTVTCPAGCWFRQLVKEGKFA